MRPGWPARLLATVSLGGAPVDRADRVAELHAEALRIDRVDGPAAFNDAERQRQLQRLARIAVELAEIAERERRL